MMLDSKSKIISFNYVVFRRTYAPIDLSATPQKSLDRALFLYIFIRGVRLSGIRASITIVHIRKFYKL